jgi:hypothetical protein
MYLFQVRLARQGAPGALNMAEDTVQPGTTRRELLRKGLFVAPTVLTLTAIPSFASAGSENGRKRKWGEDKRRWKGPSTGNWRND